MWRIAVALIWLALAAHAQVKFQASSQLVVQTISAVDRSGRPIEGLQIEDFTVTEDGVPQTVRLLEYQRLEETPLVEQPSVPPPETQPAIRYHNRRLLALYFDMSSMPPPDQLRALSAASRFVRSQMTASDLVSIMEFSSGAVRVHQDFTGDRGLLLAALNRILVVSQGLDDDDDDLPSAFGQDDGEFNIFSTDRQMSALQTAFGMLGRLNERKALVYFASGLRLSGVDNQAQLRATLNAAIRANVSFFPVDARGLTAQAPLGDAARASQGGQGMYTGGVAMVMAGSLQRSQDTLYAMAADTGGKAMFDYNDLSMGIVEAQRAAASYYVLGYYSTNTAPDGKWRRIRISLREFPSAKLDYRQGYFAPKEFRKFTGADKERQLEEALMLEDPITELTIAMEVNYFQLNRAEYYVPVMVKIPGSELALARRRGAERTVIDFIGEIKNDHGSTIQNIRDKVDIELTNSTAAELVKRHIQYDSGYTLLPGSYTIKVLARDNETGRIGTYLSRFTIPNLNREAQRVPTSSVVLSSQRIDLRDALYTAGKDKTQLTNPLVRNGQKLIPSVTRVFARNREMHVYLQAYQPEAAGGQPVAAYVSFYRGGVKVFESPLVTAAGLNDRLRTTPLAFTLTLGDLAAGRYTCQVTVLDPAAGKAAFWQAPVMVVQ